MRRIFWLAMGLTLGGILTWGALRYHLLRTDDGFRLIPKRSATLSEAYLDVRSWGVVEWGQHPDLVWALSQNGHSDLLQDSRAAERTLKNELKGLLK